MKERQKAQRDSIVDAAGRVLFRDGYAKATIDNIAAEAGMSKGGVFYYFKNKNEIFACMIQRYEEIYNARRQEIFDTLPEGPGRLLKATVIASLEYNDQSRENHNHIGLYADEEFRTRLSDLKKRIYAQLAQGCKNPQKLAMVMFVLDGMWMGRTIGEQAIPPSHIEKFRQELLLYVDEIAKDYS